MSEALDLAQRLMQSIESGDVEAEGFVQQHTFCGTSAGGDKVRAPCCLVVQVKDGRITRLEEYLDMAQFAPLFKR